MSSSRLPLVGLLVLLGGGCLLARRSALVESIELKTLDWRFRALPGAERKDADVVLLMLDQQSLDHFEKDGVYWPWPRSLYAAVLEQCRSAGAKAVVFDVLFTSPSPYGVEEDRALAKALKGAPAVLAMETSQGGSGKPVPERFALTGAAAEAARPRASARLPVKPLLEAASALGDTAAAPDQDGVFRRLPLLVGLGGRLYPSLAAAAVLALEDDKTVGVEDGSLRLGSRRVPLDDGRFLVRFHGPRPYATYPLGRALAGDLPAGALKDKLVLVGYSAPGLMDLRPSPVSPTSPGTQIIAAAVDNIRSGDFLERAPACVNIIILLAGLCGAAFAALRLGLWAAAGTTALLSAGLGALAFYLFGRGMWADIVAPQLGVWLGFAAASAYGYAAEGRQKRHIQRAFSHYLAPELVAELAAHPEKLALGGERRELTCYFSDIEGFTSFSEKLPPEKLTYLMNRYLGEMTDTILESGGTLDKYIGDAIMAYWGAPMPRADHALVACRAAVANQKKLDLLREALIAEGFPPVRARIGLNSGVASVGNMGSAKRFSYTALGDDINLASRLEGANKVYGSYILISESTRAAAESIIETRELDRIMVKGKAVPTKVHELLGLKGETDPKLLARARAFEAALALYHARKWDEAAAAFAAVEKQHGADAACELYRERCAAFKEEPPAPDWDGSFALKEK